ncbi:MAG: hypothetical protein Q9217_005026 [Psora testacea]
MEQLEGQNEYSQPSGHQYPDPDSAAYATSYPWVGDDDGYVPAAFQQSSFASFREDLNTGQGRETNERRSSGHFNTSQWDATHELGYVSSDNLLRQGTPQQDLNDETSSQNPSHDEDISDSESQVFATMPANTLGTPIERQELLSVPSTDRWRGSSARVSVSRGGRARRGRSGIGRGCKGMKRGLRKPIEPGVEFKAQLSEATMAFTQSDFEKAELFTLKALQLNPEMFEAHNLLSEIHAARGDKDKALSAAWNGAHTKPRDIEMWSRIASIILERSDNDRDATLRDAIYCYTRIIAVDKRNVEARYQRATLNRELGHKRKVIAEYEYILKELPHDTTVLRHLAEIYIELNEAAQALQHYEATIVHLQATESEHVLTFTWSDVNIVAELYGFQRRYDEGISTVKKLARWLLGRKDDSCWEHYDEDDREWDCDDHPRRNGTPGFTCGVYETLSYGHGLPLELRVKLGIFRLYSDKHDLTEAITHFEWLNPDDDQDGARLFDYPDLFREAANALRARQHFEEALRYYEPLRRASDYINASFFMEIALCYRAVGSKADAEGCYKTILEHDPSSTEARVAMWNMSKEPDTFQADIAGPTKLSSVFKQKSRRRLCVSSIRRREAATVPPSSAFSMLATSTLPLCTVKQPDLHQDSARQEEVQVLFIRWQMLSDQRHTNEKDNAAWSEAARLLLQIFRENRVFYPSDRHHRFYGYSRLARAIANRPKYERGALISKSDSIMETLEGDQVVIPDQFMGISFAEWLDIFLENGLSLAKSGDPNAAYEGIASAYNANVFYHSPKAVLAIHICWFTCALLANDDETLCNIARWFMMEYQFVTDCYRLFSALNRLCDTPYNSWYNCGPSQKFMLRQLKAMDFSFQREGRRKSLFQERASFTAKDSDGNPIQAEDLDVSLLMLYGHILYAGKSYPYAVNYFLRALASDPGNPVIKLSLALGYIHWAFKRQAQNRHQILVQGFAFLMEYYDCRQESGSDLQKQEAEYNVGRAYHLLGVIHLAIPYYERCLALGNALEMRYGSSITENFAQEAAFALQGHWAASGNMDRAREVTERWLVI